MPNNSALSSRETSQVLRQAILTMATEQAAAFKAGDLEAFMRWFDLDIVSDYYMRRWFTGYALKTAHPTECDFEVGDVDWNPGHTSLCTITFLLRYAQFESETATFHNRLRFIDSGDHLRIADASISLMHPLWPDQPVRLFLVLATASVYTAVKGALGDRATVRLYPTPLEHAEQPIIVAGTPKELFERPETIDSEGIELLTFAEDASPRVVVWGHTPDLILEQLDQFINSPQEQALTNPAAAHQLQSRRDELDEQRWWEANELTEIARASSDHLKASLYARAVPKSQRYRNTHPEIDSAVILSDMMTRRAARLSFSFGTDDLVSYIKRVNHYAQRLMTAKTYAELRQADQSYFPARELSLQALYNIDEILALRSRDTRQPAEVGCPEISSFYVAMLRLGGIDPWKALILVQPFHFLVLFQLPDGHYVVSVNEIMPMSPRRLYGDTDVRRIVLPAFYVDETGRTNMPTTLQARVRTFIQDGVPIFSLPVGKEAVDTLPMEAEPILSVRNCLTPVQLCTAMKRHVFTMSQKHPASPFTWAKYAYQTLLVPQPQAYLIWSLRAPECKAFVKEHPTFELALAWMAQHLGDSSIFEEPDRIMTADQVLRHRRGTAKDRAVLLYTVARLFGVTQVGGVVLTTEKSYVILVGERTQTIYDAQSLQPVSNLEGKVILAFDDQTSHDPLQTCPGPYPLWLEFVL